MENIHIERQDGIRELMARDDIRALVISEPAALLYLTGEKIDAGERLTVFVISENGSFWIKNELFVLSDNESVPVYTYPDGGDGVRFLGNHLPEGKIGIDKNWQAGFLLALLNEFPELSFVNGSPCVDSLRMIKDREEIEKMRASSRLNDEMMRRLVHFLKPGVTEKECADALRSWYKEGGAEDVSFPPIVSFGEHGADPHHMPDDTALQRNTVVLIDIGCVKDGYCSDMTRTVFFGSVAEKERKVHELVKKANEAAEAAVKPGVPLSLIDKTARDVITEGGYGPFFTHRLGHFIGLTDHEAGEVSATSPLIARPGMIFSIEPGIYLPGEFGVRVEDLVLVTEDGAEILNHVTHNPEIQDI